MSESLKIVIDGPSGVGKTTIIHRLCEQNSNIKLSKSYTTRQIRNGETKGLEYEFISKEEFLQLKENNFFLEFENIFNEYYGTPDAITEDNHTIFNLNIDGVKKIKNNYKNSLLIFILPKSIDILKNRLNNRGCLHRFENIQQEFQNLDIFDHFVINENLDDAVAEINNLILITEKNIKNKNLAKSYINIK